MLTGNDFQLKFFFLLSIRSGNQEKLTDPKKAGLSMVSLGQKLGCDG